MIRYLVKFSTILSLFLVCENLRESSAKLCDNSNMIMFRRCFNGTSYEEMKNSMKSCLERKGSHDDKQLRLSDKSEIFCLLSFDEQIHPEIMAMRNNCTDFMGVQMGAKSGLENFMDQTVQCGRKGMNKFVDYLNICDKEQGLNLNVTSSDVLNFMKHEATVSTSAMWGPMNDACQQSAQKCFKFTEIGTKEKFESCGKSSFQDCSWKETFPTICNCSVEIMQTKMKEVLDDFESCMASTGKQSLIKKLRQKYETSVQANSKSFCQKETAGGSWSSKSNRWSTDSKQGSDPRLAGSKVGMTGKNAVKSSSTM